MTPIIPEYEKAKSAQQVQVVERFTDWDREDRYVHRQLQDYLDENPHLRCVTLAGDHRSMIAVFEPVAQLAGKGE